MYETVETDVLVVGGGGAGCRAAIEAHDQGADVVMLVKGRLGNSGCTLNVGTSAAVGPWGVEEDSTYLAMKDLLSYGGFLGNQELAKVLVEESPDRVVEMEEWGIDFQRNDDGSIAVTRSAEHTYARNFFFKSRSPSQHDYGFPPGMAIMDVLVEQVRSRDIRVLDDFALIDLMRSGSRVVGCTAIDCRENTPVVVSARSVVLATGTYSRIFSPTTVSPFETGDGQAAAFRAGAELTGMEASQFVATSTSYPPGTLFLNGNGETFLQKYGIESTVGLPKERTVHAVWSEIVDAGDPEHETMLLDMREPLKDAAIAARFIPIIEENLRQGDVRYGSPESVVPDPRQEPIESSPRSHTTIGGVRINEKCATSLAGLYAAGAVAGGIYGHARPEGYTSMITLVFGRRAGLHAAEAAKEAERPPPKEGGVQASLGRASGLIDSGAGADPDDVKGRIQAITRKHAWVFKDEGGLLRGLEEVRRLRDEFPTLKAKNGFEWTKALEVSNLLLSAELLLMGSIERRESRGAFFRSDYTETDDANWLKNIVYSQVDGEPVLKTVPAAFPYCAPQSVESA